MSLALTRIVEIEEGMISIDGINLREVDINKVRSKITIIPQDPTLFAGSLRFNIDPEWRATDEEIIDLLREAGIDHLLLRKSER